MRLILVPIADYWSNCRNELDEHFAGSLDSLPVKIDTPFASEGAFQEWQARAVSAFTQDKGEMHFDARVVGYIEGLTFGAWPRLIANTIRDYWVAPPTEDA